MKERERYSLFDNITMKRMGKRERMNWVLMEEYGLSEYVDRKGIH